MVSGLANFGQSNFGQSIFGQSIFCVVVLRLVLVWVGVLSVLLLCVVLCCWCVLLCVVLLFCCCMCVVGVVCVLCVLRTPLRRTPLRPKFRSFFSLSRHSFYSFLLSCWSFSLKFGGVFEDRDPQMHTFGLSDCRVKPRRPHQVGCSSPGDTVAVER